MGVLQVFLPHSKTIHITLVGDRKLPPCVTGWCVRAAGDLARVYSCLVASELRNKLQQSETVIRKKQRLMEKEQK